MQQQEGARRAPRVLVPPIAALQFLTLCPPIIRRMFTSTEMGQAVGYFSTIGALLGALLAALDWGLRSVLSTSISTVLVLAASVAATGAIHLDGFFDACDGLFGGHTPASRLEIMRDERVGAFGLAGGVLLILLKFTALSTAVDRVAALLLSMTLSRWAIALAVVLFPYARDKGLGRAMKDYAGAAQVAQATAIALLVSWFAAGWMGLLAMGLAAAITWAAARFALKRLPGLTGDLYGTISELVEVSLLLAFAVGARK